MLLGYQNNTQIRWFFSDKTSLSLTYIAGQPAGWMQCEYDHNFVCADAGEDASGREIAFAGSDDGYVYRIDTGTSFDGEKIESLLRLPFSYSGSSIQKKRFRRIEMEMETSRPISLRVMVDTDYAEGQVSQYTAVTPVSGGYWDDIQWNEFYWDGTIVSTPVIYPNGLGRNLSISFHHSDDVDPPHTLQVIRVSYLPAGIQI
jgi:hypothetical protein